MRQSSWLVGASLKRQESQSDFWRDNQLVWNSLAIVVGDYVLLILNRHSQHLDMNRPEQFPLPTLPAGPLFISGNVPQWLAVAVALCGAAVDRPLIAMHQPRPGRAVVISSRVTDLHPGVPLPVLD